MKTKNFFKYPKSAAHIHYEALRSHFLDGIPLDQVALSKGLSLSYLIKIKREYEKKIAAGIDPFFVEIKKGPKIRHKGDRLRDKIIALRKRDFSIIDIKAALDAQGGKNHEE